MEAVIAFAACGLLIVQMHRNYLMIKAQKAPEDLQAQIREYEHALEHTVDCNSCDQCVRLCQSALDGKGREDFKW